MWLAKDIEPVGGLDFDALRTEQRQHMPQKGPAACSVKSAIRTALQRQYRARRLFRGNVQTTPSADQAEQLLMRVAEQVTHDLLIVRAGSESAADAHQAVAAEIEMEQ